MNNRQAEPPPLPGNDTPLDAFALLEKVPAILYIADLGADGPWVYISPWIEPILGFTPAEWQADPLLWKQRLHPEDRERVLEDEARSAATRDLGDSAPIEYRMLHRDGHTVWIRDESMLHMGADGRIRWYGVLSDITARKRAELALERRVRASAAIARLGEHALARVPLEDLLEEACASAASVLEVEWATILKVSPDLEEVEVVAGHGFSELTIGQVLRGLTPDTQVGSALRTGRPSQVDDWEQETRLQRSEALDRYGARASVCARIEGNDGPWGTLSAVSPRPRRFSEADMYFIQALANVLSEAFARQRVEDAIEHRALHDPLTGLPNRVLFLDRLEHAFERVRRRHTLAAVLFVDVDHFKQINDTLGHHAGDQMLVAVAARLRDTVRPSDTVARFGGDEFGLLLEEISNERDAIATAERIAAGFTRPFVLEAGTHFVTASIGIALAAGHQLPSDLLREADEAMYRAKQRGRARYDLFDEDMRARASTRIRLEEDIRHAVESREMQLLYEPVVRLRDGRIVGAEARLRWEQTRLNDADPAELLAIAEESGVFERVGSWMLEEACRDAVRWSRAVGRGRPPQLGFDLSAQQLSNQRAPDLVAAAIGHSGIDPARLLFDVNEQHLADDGSGHRRTLERLQELGAGVVVHEFGAGASSLSRLTSLPVSSIKLDRSLVAQLPDDDRAVRAVIAIAAALELGVIADGVETQAQSLRLQELGCKYGQGPLFSTAIDSPTLIAKLQDNARLPGSIT